MGNIGPLEIILILVVALLVFGPKRLPEIGRSVGRGMREFRRASSDLRDEFERAVDVNEPLPERAEPSPANESAEVPVPQPRPPVKRATTAKKPAAKRATARSSAPAKRAASAKKPAAKRTPR